MNYTVTDTELIQSANAIRAKLDSTLQIPFISGTGFKASIDSIPAGKENYVSVIVSTDENVTVKMILDDLEVDPYSVVTTTYTFHITTSGNWLVKIIKDGIEYTDRVNIEVSKVVSIATMRRVGGRIYYDDGDNGAVYTFYDSSKNIITDTSISGLANAYYYAIVGTPTKNRWYVYDNTSHTTADVTVTDGLTDGIYWGYYGTITGASSTALGGGLTNTNTVLGLGVPTDYTPNVWGYINACRNELLNGCNDWFLGSDYDQTRLKWSGLVDWYATIDMLSSAETDEQYNRSWLAGGNQEWRATLCRKSDKYAKAVTLRAF